METILAGDIGGTNTRLALFDAGSLNEPRLLRVYRSGDYESLNSIVSLFLQECKSEAEGAPPVRAGFGVAGPVDGRIIKLTNLPWVVDADRIGKTLGCEKVAFLNDFSANCLAVSRLRPEHMQQIGGGTRKEHGPIAVLGAGTGLGQGFLVWSGERYLVVPSEGGHVDFAPRNPLEIRLLSYLTAKLSRVSYERVLSGPGLVNVYEFFRDSEQMAESAQVRNEMRHDDPGAVITRNGLERSDPLCERALDLFCIAYGAEAGNLALKVLATGGVYLAGGIAGRIVSRLEEGPFRYAFEQKGRYTQFLESVGTYLITHPQPGLMGAAIAAAEL